jgi:hypothetical protein
VEDAEDRRRTVLCVTAKGMGLLHALSASHARELDEFGPQLIRALEQIKTARTARHNRGLAIAANAVSNSNLPASEVRKLRSRR